MINDFAEDFIEMAYVYYIIVILFIIVENEALIKNVILTDSLILLHASSEKILETSLGIYKYKYK